MAETLTAAAVRTAISRVLTSGQSSTIGDMTINRANLKTAWDLLEKLENREARSSTRPVFRGFDLSGAGY